MPLPNPGIEIDPACTALLITDPQNDFLSLVYLGSER